jgi:hypothetical protein
MPASKDKQGNRREFKNNPIYDKFAIKEEFGQCVKKAAILDS